LLVRAKKSSSGKPALSVVIYIDIHLCFQAKLKLEMEIEQVKKRVQKESDRKDEDMEEMKSNYTRKV
jgi:hypothetical protein